MNRELKFRIWEHHNNKFATHPFGFSLNKNFELDCPNDGFDGIAWKFTYQPYTGFKDKHGTDIYEGDILRDFGTNYLFEVFWFDQIAGFSLAPKGEYPDEYNAPVFRWQDLHRLEVVGNIFDKKYESGF